MKTSCRLRLLGIIVGLLLWCCSLADSSCEAGFTLLNGSCTDINECEGNRRLCGKHADCINLPGSFRCNCHPGYMQYHEKDTCDELDTATKAPKTTPVPDMNECELNIGLCGKHADCINLPVSFRCDCHPGYMHRQAKQICFAPPAKPTPALVTSTHKMADSTTRNNSETSTLQDSGLHTTELNPTTKVPPTQTTPVPDIDECAQTPWLCGPNAQCTNTVGSYTCSCNPGLFPNTGLRWILNQTRCEDLTKIQDGKTCNIPINTGTSSHLKSSSAWFCLITNFNSINFTSGYQLQQVAGVLSSALNDISLWSNLTRDEKSVAAEAYLDTVERAMLQLTEPSDVLLRKNVRSDNLDMELLIIPFKHNTSEEQLRANKNTLEIKLGKLMEENKQDQITVGFASYTGMESVLDGSFYKNQSSIQLNSQVVTATIGRNHHKLSEPVHLTFHHNELRKTKEEVICVYWKYEGKESSWSTEGCTMLHSNQTHTVCSCDHLSSFAVLMALDESQMQENVALTVINYIAVIASLVCLSLAIFTFLFCRSIQKANTTIHLHLSVCLFLAHFLFLVGVSRTEKKVLCAVIAGLLHYLFTASFAWMCLEGVQLYLLVRNLKVVKYSSRQGLRRRYMLLAGYGSPALIVAVSAGVFPVGYGTNKFCWLSHDRGFVWSFLGPVCVTIAVNTILFIAILWTLRSQMCGLNTDVSKVKDTRLLTFKAIAHCFIMGCSWILGFFQGLEFFRFAFVIINSLQGPFIFLVHCVLNQQVRMEYRKWFGRIYKQKDSSELTSSTVPMEIITKVSAAESNNCSSTCKGVLVEWSK
ncbi:adhesion G protein-coupled receptor E3-like isoform X1 [Acipenser ruthenus]|uniref:adhesion G protein-coupled receptor E3-like isoform X1 n=1 Tax=Acipenser ruthenus TaxID=7906 RepID=UPI002740965A|nr:adhesion G protein-coupled receptor E3-like isoform X1 [Acipenser ruthenus]